MRLQLRYGALAGNGADWRDDRSGRDGGHLFKAKSTLLQPLPHVSTHQSMKEGLRLYLANSDYVRGASTTLDS